MSVPAEKALSTEPPALHPVFLVGGACHGQAYLLNDRPQYLDAVAKREVALRLVHEGIDARPFQVETYSLREARVHGWDTPWLYYAHDSLDEQAALFALWSFPCGCWCLCVQAVGTSGATCEGCKEGTHVEERMAALRRSDPAQDEAVPR